MNINLKQPEIEAALRLYIGRKLDLRNSTLTIVFNMGRGDNGLSANLTIDDINIPGFTNADAKDVGTIKAGPGTAQLALQVDPTGPSDAFKAMAAGGLMPEAIDAGSKVGEASTLVGVIVVEDPVEVGITVTGVLTEAATVTTGVMATPETEAAKAEPVAEAKTTEAPAQVKSSTSLFG